MWTNPLCKRISWKNGIVKDEKRDEIRCDCHETQQNVIHFTLSSRPKRKKESTVRKHVDILAKKKQSGFHSSKIQQLGHHTSPKAQSKPRHTLHIYVCLVVECSNHFNCWRCYQCVENAQSNLISQLPLTVWKTSNAPHFSMHNRLWLDTQINE